MKINNRRASLYYSLNARHTLNTLEFLCVFDGIENSEIEGATRDEVEIKLDLNATHGFCTKVFLDTKSFCENFNT